MAKRGPKAGTEAAKHGGQAVRDKYGPEFYERLGRKGGETLKAERAVEHYAAIGRKGGETTRDRMGAEHYARSDPRADRRRPGAARMRTASGCPLRGTTVARTAHR